MNAIVVYRGGAARRVTNIVSQTLYSPIIQRRWWVRATPPNQPKTSKRKCEKSYDNGEVSKKKKNCVQTRKRNAQYFKLWKFNIFL